MVAPAISSQVSVRREALLKLASGFSMAAAKFPLGAERYDSGSVGDVVAGRFRIVISAYQRAAVASFAPAASDRSFAHAICG